MIRVRLRTLTVRCYSTINRRTCGCDRKYDYARTLIYSVRTPGSIHEHIRFNLRDS